MLRPLGTLRKLCALMIQIGCIVAGLCCPIPLHTFLISLVPRLPGSDPAIWCACFIFLWIYDVFSHKTGELGKGFLYSKMHKQIGIMIFFFWSRPHKAWELEILDGSIIVKRDYLLEYYC